MNEPEATPPLAPTKKINKPPLLFSKTQEVLARLEKHLDSTFVAYWNSNNGSVCDSDVVALHAVLRSLGSKKKITLFLKSGGGSGLAALRIVHLLRHYGDRLVVLVPLECASAATMIALGADEIHMGPLAYLTAVDTSLTHDLSPVDSFNRRVSVSHDELNRVIDLWRKESGKEAANPYAALFGQVHPLVIGAVDRASSLSIKVCTEILSYHVADREEAEKISIHLNSSYPAHDYPITIQEARTLGLKVQPLDDEVNALLLELNNLYSEMGQNAATHHDEAHYHNHAILNILEGREIQVYFQNDTDWLYRAEERRWARMNDESSWRKVERRNGKIQKVVFHIS